jgi:hypothetical protein
VARTDETELLGVDRELVEAAVARTSAWVRSLDATSVASTLRVGARERLVYDRRFAEATSAAELEVVGPGT